jgi:hypothetical protein
LAPQGDEKPPQRQNRSFSLGARLFSSTLGDEYDEQNDEAAVKMDERVVEMDGRRRK